MRGFFIFILVHFFSLKVYSQTDTIIYLKGSNYSIAKSKLTKEHPFCDSSLQLIINKVSDSQLEVNHKVYYLVAIKRSIIDYENPRTGNIDSLPCYNMYYQRKGIRYLFIKPTVKKEQ